MKVMIDGKPCSAEPGQTVLEVARSAGIDIPTLCHHGALAPFSACRVCLVAVERNGRRMLLPSCSLDVEDEMVVETTAEDVDAVRTMILRLLLARCPGVEKVRELAARYGVTQSGFPEGDDDCILCGLCVRLCSELVGVHALAFANRGVDCLVETPYGDPSEVCIGCGACAEVCPTGHIVVRESEGEREIVPFGTKHKLVACPECGRGYVTEKQLAFLEQKLGEKSEILGGCPVCKGRRRAEELQKVYESLSTPRRN